MFDPSTPIDAVLRGAILALIGLAWIAALVRAVGLRTLSKMTAIDFVVTLATGSLLATMATASGWPPFLQALAAVTAINLAQWGYARLRRGSDRFRRFAENQPMLLVRDGRYIDPALRRARVARADIESKLREANVADIAQVHAVVLETTGDISILHGLDRDPATIGDLREPQ